MKLQHDVTSGCEPRHFSIVMRGADRALTGKVEDDAEGAAHKLERVGQAGQPAGRASTAWKSTSSCQAHSDQHRMHGHQHTKATPL